MADPAPINLANIQGLAAAWYEALDQHAPDRELMQFLSDRVKMDLPEKKLVGLFDFKAWYSGGLHADGTKMKGVINFFFDESHNVVSIKQLSPSAGQPKVEVVVAWQASWFLEPAAKSGRTSLQATQIWTLEPSEKNHFGIAIAGYEVTGDFECAPGYEPPPVPR